MGKSVRRGVVLTTFAPGGGPQAVPLRRTRSRRSLRVLAALALAAPLVIGLQAPASASVSFGPKTDFFAGVTPRFVASDDFNGDGVPDLVVANLNPDTVSVLLGDGTGSFGPRADFATGASPRAVATADFNGDGARDLATANADDDTVSVLLGDGTGSFGPKTDFPALDVPLSVASGDLDADENTDLVVANFESDRVNVLLGTGTGSFLPVPPDNPTGDGPRSVALGDFNGDGTLDLATANDLADTVSVLLGLPFSDGEFAGPTDFATGANPRSVASADVDGDGALDLVTANVSADTVSVLLGDGAGSFGPATDFATGDGPFSVASADFDGDGALDLAVANELADSVSVLEGDGAGSFGPPTDFGTADQPLSVTSADFDGDGRPDLVAANFGVGTVSVLLNQTTNTAPTASDDAYVTDEDSPLSVPAPGVLANDTDDQLDPLTAALVTGPSNAASFTFNADGSFDYTPEANFSGDDPFTYTADDGEFDSNEATVTIMVDAVNDPPTVQVAGGQCLSDVAAQAQVALTVGDVESAPGSLGVSATSANQALIPNANLVLSGSGADRILAVSAVPKRSGTALITIEVTDGTDTTPLAITVKVGGPKNDTLNGTSGADVLLGMAGANTLNGMGGNDLLCGGTGSDQLNGGDGDDVLAGGRGNDVVSGALGDDDLLGQRGDDTLIGGAGADLFSGGPGVDASTDFNAGEGDTTDGT